MAVEIPENGVRADSLDVEWAKSPKSREEGNCVEVAPLAGGGVAFRNSRHKDGPALIFNQGEADAFAWGMENRAFDHAFHR
ncbi:DUF397 domain-containing protein [Kitasatospora sp. NPDC091257]|uniref:DUF397 domain-containing protein n=1 Tax=Kitasatospora sp. NPDC091257 TaxID=3364084 RepID=UPI0038085015